MIARQRYRKRLLVVFVIGSACLLWLGTYHRQRYHDYHNSDVLKPQDDNIDTKEPHSMMSHSRRRRRQRRRLKRNNTGQNLPSDDNTKQHTTHNDDDPCPSPPLPPPGTSQQYVAPLGVLYVVSGSEDFVKNALLPVVDYLRNGLGIPDASLRRPDEPQWAIATEKRLCRSGVFGDALDFFNVVITDIPLEHPRFIDGEGGTEDDGGRKNRRHRRLDLLGNYKGEWTKAETEEKHFIKAFKVAAMSMAPFKITIYLDTDSAPCVRDFPYALRDALGTADVALTPHFNEGYTYPVNHRKHWEIKYNRNNGYNSNVHSSACMVLNMESPKTRQLLKLWHVGFGKMFRKTMDQFALGEAFKYMWNKHRIDHVDLDPSLYADPVKENEKGIHPSCDGSGRWMIVHKIRVDY